MTFGSVFRQVVPLPVKTSIKACLGNLEILARALVRTFLSCLRGMFGNKLFIRMYHWINGQIEPIISVSDIKFDATDFRPYQRAITLFSKEPDTINWINDFIKKSDVFYDIGANIGVFSLFAATEREAIVMAFEPMAKNYEILNKNIYLNNLDDQIQAFNIAFHDSAGAFQLALPNFKAGWSGSQLEDKYSTANSSVTPPAFRQGAWAMTLDEFVFGHDQPFPNHIKIDVDGNESRIVTGMSQVLTDSRLKSIAVELDLDGRDEDGELVENLVTHGFKQLDDDRYQNYQYMSWTNVRNRFFIRLPDSRKR